MELHTPFHPPPGSRLRNREAVFRELLARPTDGFFVVDAQGCFVEADDTLGQLLGCGVDALIGRPTTDFVHPASQATLRRQIERITTCERRNYRLELLHQDGSAIPALINTITTRNAADGTVSGAAGFITDLRDTRDKPLQAGHGSPDTQAARHHHSQLQLAATVFSESRDAILITDGQRRVISVNRAFTALTGYAADEVAGTEAPLIAASHHAPGFLDALLDELARTDHWNGEAWSRRRNGAIFPQWLSISTVRDDNAEILHYVAMFSDLSERKAAEERADFLARHDLLTRLPNRFLLRDRAEQAFAHAVRAETRVALLLLDLDHFKQINDSLGHPAGDALLQTFADRLRSTTRDTDTVSRQGGDEFLVLLTDIRDSDDIAPIVEKIMHTLAQPCLLAGQEMSISCSVGLAVYPEDGTDFDTLIRNADAAMYNAKEAGRNTFRFYSQQMNEDAVQRLDIQNRLRRALERKEFVLHYQPLIDLSDSRIVGAEALIRWNCPELGMQPPGVFIPVAEDSGLIVEIGEWVLREACRQARAWQDAGHRELVLAVNLSPLQFARGNLVETVRQALADSGANPALIELEITENVLVKDTEQVLATVRQLHAMGLRLAIDDFGTGYSSLAYLRRFAVEKLKIDQSFVRDLPTDPDAGAIVRAVIQMAKSLKIAVLAEGVETADIAHDLRLLGCDYAQGYYFGRPMPADAFIERLPPPR